MKILLVNKFLYPRGGAETYFLKLGKYFESKGHQVAYFGMYDEKNTVGNKEGLYTRNKDFHSGGLERILYPFEIIYSVDAYRKMSRIIDSFQPDVIHLNNINFQLTPSVIDAAYKKKVPVVQTVHDSQMICPGHLLYRNKELCTKCIEKGKWNCAKDRCIHGSRVKSILGSIEGILYDKKSTYDKVSMYICPSRFIEGILHTNKRYIGKTMILPNFIELPKTDKVEKKDYILYFGRLSEEKGIEIFLDVCRQLPEISFKIAGSGPMEKACCGLPNVEYVGMKTGESLNKLIAEARLAVCPSLCYENCPLSVLEAVSLGTPVMVSPRGGSKELVKDGQTGVLLSEPVSAGQIAEKIRSLLQNEKKLTQMSEACRKEREAVLTVERYGEIVEKLYGKVKEGM